jgi:hypothetical protein
MERQDLIRKIEELPPSQLAEIEQFVESVMRESNLDQALSEYASSHCGTTADYDSELESAAIDHLLRETSFRRTPRRRSFRRLMIRQRDNYGVSIDVRRYARRRQ